MQEERTMLLKMDIYTIVRLKESGKSFRQIARDTGIDRKTISQKYHQYKQALHDLQEGDRPIEEIQERIVGNIKYDTSNRPKLKYNDAMDQYLDEILEFEKQKLNDLGITHKQKLTNRQIHKLIRDAGFDIGLTTISEQVKLKRNKHKECFIKQSYDLGDRVEYDFGEVKLKHGNIIRKYYIAVFAAPALGFTWARLYKRQDKSVFLDSHVRFFDEVSGVYREVVYDNMRNVVKKFIGRNHKELNEDLISMALYYGFEINVTNCFSGNEKGFVESRVKKVRNEAFALRYEFDTFEDAQEYLRQEMKRLNSNVDFIQEQAKLLPYKPKLNLANITVNRVNKYSFIQKDNVFYSVPEHLVGREVTVHSYFDHLNIYANRELICTHKKGDELFGYVIDITHYLNTFLKKPGAIKHSSALKQIPKLEFIYKTYYNDNPNEFVLLLKEYQNLQIDELVEVLKEQSEPMSKQVVESNVVQLTKSELMKVTELYQLGGSHAD